MDVYVERAPAYVSAAKIMLAAAAPAQRLIQKPVLTHLMCNRQAKIILVRDGYKDLAEIVDEFSLYLDKGVSWADEGFKNMSHFLNPRTLKGLYGWTDAARECSLYWNKAASCWHSANFEKAFFYLGAALHLVQDLCVPHHAMGIVFDGHQEYEDWVEINRDNFRVNDQGIYGLAESPGQWLKMNAAKAIRHYHNVKAGSPKCNYEKATWALLPRAQRVSAGFLHHFLKKVAKNA